MSEEGNNHIDSATKYPLTPLTVKSKESGTSRIPLKYKVIGAISAVALLGGIGAGIHVATSGEAPVKAKAVATGEAHPTEQPTPHSSIIVVETAPPVEQLIAMHEIKASQQPEALSQNIASEISNWEMAGSDTVVKDLSDQIRKTSDASDEAFSKFLDEYTAKQADIFGPALFGKDYASNADVQRALTGYKTINKTVLDNIIASSQDKHPYVRSTVYTAPVVSSTDTSLSFHFVDKDNAGQGNRVVDSPNGTPGTMNCNYEILNNTIIIKKFTITL